MGTGKKFGVFPLGRPVRVLARKHNTKPKWLHKLLRFMSDRVLKDVETAGKDPDRVRNWVSLTRNVLDKIY